ncbi:uncharacterized protein PGTG_21559 [Puccinia graminis f. sp. tritici CRL 75-36-700-3]|uniref:Uncharacterized protein n=1 Tax=Puccinia graminis f. sp. tritici (strain CRL 75-36-700-3 / race SCCL) TaxID=418459 RepID=H6QRZ1_PUCGT|nr:uncharacterized protein PGTG_21559 [Puccinia graminis f. sp. tritici CRL 75-36-700-3]EHS63426.1 hypothetical protein PGTG_21559 [Puccinia graminis f. sp. tritici CRL 75-36-700-3]
MSARTDVARRVLLCATTGLLNSSDKVCPKTRRTGLSDELVYAVSSENKKIVIIWKVINKDLDAFKAEVIRGIKSEEDKFLGFFVEHQENARNIFWNVVIPFGGAFAGNHKRRLDSVETFKDFLLVAEGTSETRKIVCRLVQKDPKDIAKVCFLNFTL